MEFLLFLNRPICNKEGSTSSLNVGNYFKFVNLKWRTANNQQENKVALQIVTKQTKNFKLQTLWTTLNHKIFEVDLNNLDETPLYNPQIARK